MARQKSRKDSAQGNSEGPDTGALQQAIAFHLRLAQNASFQAFSALAGDSGLRPGRYAILEVIGRNPRISQTALSTAIGRDKTTLTPALRDLIGDGLVERAVNPQDRRSRTLVLTKSGEERRKALAAVAANHDARLKALFTPQEATLLLSLLERLTDKLSSPGQ
jgi:DNA-binding MarR family transcriptional regulator